MARRTKAFMDKAVPQIRKLAGAGLGDAEIGRTLGLSSKTVQRYRSDTRNSLDIPNTDGPNRGAPHAAAGMSASDPGESGGGVTWREYLDGLVTRYGRRDPRYRTALRAWVDSGADMDSRMPSCPCLPDDLDRSPCPGHAA